MSAESVAQELVWVMASTRSDVYHTQADCRAFNRTHREPRQLPASMFPDRDLCRYCAGIDETVTGGWPDEQCRHCSAAKVGGSCPFCEQFDAIHDVPRDADYCPVEVAE